MKTRVGLKYPVSYCRPLKGVSWGELLQLYLVINLTDLVEPTEPGSLWEKF